MSTRIWHDRFEDDWMRAFPLGNGRIGAMVYGNPDRETIEINEESLWSGRQLKETYCSSSETLQELRSLLFAEKYKDAADLCEKSFLAKPRRVRFYESFGEIFIDFEDKGEYINYRKELELSEAIARVSYDRVVSEAGKKVVNHYRSEVFISEKYDVFVYRMVCDGNPFSCNITMQRNQDAYTSALNDTTLLLNGRITFKTDDAHGEGLEGMQFGARIHAVSDGVISSDKHSLKIENATEFTIYAAFATNYNVGLFDIDENIDYRLKLETDIRAAIAVNFDDLRREHIKEHRKWFDTLSLQLDAPTYEDIPTDERLKRITETEDRDLYVLYYNFGRYLLIESSGKRATLPANLQGIWCSGFTPPWGSDYHTNINLQMNYWPVETANMSDAFKPFVHFMKKISEFGVLTARELFGTGGWLINHTTDIFGRTGVHDSVQNGFFPMAGPWLCLNLWEHYEFTNDMGYLKEIYPILKGSCEFVADFLVENENGYLVTNPSTSPENTFFYYDENGEKQESKFTYGATIDFQIIYALFTRTIEAYRILEDDRNELEPGQETAVFLDTLQRILSKIPPLRVSKRYETICEWIKDYEESEPGHRHISHLFGLFPGDQINETEPEIYQAAKNTIARRLSNGGGATGWSRAWIINFYARLKDKKNAMEHLTQLMKISTAENLFDMHPPFQIDGNFGAVSGITEMLIQSHLGAPGERIIEILPALPVSWDTGSVKGLKTRGNFIFDIDWEKGKPVKVTITSLDENILRMKWDSDFGKPVSTKDLVWEDPFVMKMNMAAGECVVLES